MALVAIAPYDYATDGTFARSSLAWAINPNTGLVDSFAADARRVFTIGGKNYVLIEGSRTNHVPDGEQWSAPWANVADDADPTANPTGGGTSNLVGAAETATRSITLDGPIQAVAISCFFQPISAPDVVDIELTNTLPATALTHAMGAAAWSRAALVREVPDDTNPRVFTVDAFSSADDVLGWGAQVETGPASAPVLFASSPIVTTGSALTRAGDEFGFIAGIGSSEASRTRGFSVAFRPLFSSSQVQAGDRFVLHSITDALLTNEFYAIALEVEAGPVVRAIVRRAGQVVAQSAAVTFSADQEVTIRSEATGDLVTSGFTTGNGTVVGTAYSIPQGTVLVGMGAGSTEAFGLLAPLDYLVDEPQIVSALPVTRNRVRVAFSEAMKATSAGDPDDALNPATYTPTAGVALPALSSVVAVTATEFDLLFAANLPADELVDIAVANIVAVGFPQPEVGTDTADFTSIALPTITVAQPLSLSTVLVQFSERVKQASAGAADDALNPANYFFTAGVALPAITGIIGDPFGAQATVVFADPLPESELITVRVEDIVTVVDGEPVDPVPTVQFLSAESPETVGVEQTSTSTIRVTFSIPVRQLNPAGLTDALNPANYLLTSPNATLPRVQYVTPANGAPVLEPEPLFDTDSVTPTAPTTVVELVFDKALPAGAFVFVTPMNIVSADFGVPIVLNQPSTATLVDTFVATAVAAPGTEIAGTIPATAQPGDICLAYFVVGTGPAPTSVVPLRCGELPPGWKHAYNSPADVKVSFQSVSQHAAFAWRILGPGEAGSVVTFSRASDSTNLMRLVLSVYRPSGDPFNANDPFDTKLFQFDGVPGSISNLGIVPINQPGDFAHTWVYWNSFSDFDELFPTGWTRTARQVGGGAPDIDSHRIADNGNGSSGTAARYSQVGDCSYLHWAFTFAYAPVSSFLEIFAEGNPARPLPVQSLDGRYDLANPQTPTDAGNDPLGTFQFESGDIANDTGRPYLRKRIFRRLSTTPGGFFHLGDYGLRPQDKVPVTATLLRELQRDIEAQVASEPDVVAVRARLREIAPGVVGVRLRVQDGLGPFELEGRIDLTGDASA